MRRVPMRLAVRPSGLVWLTGGTDLGSFVGVTLLIVRESH